VGSFATEYLPQVPDVHAKLQTGARVADVACGGGWAAAPPPNIPKPPDVQPGVSTRERLSQHEVDPACSGCHQLMDPIGFGLENYDAIGRFRSGRRRHHRWPR
jgi:hypothetical protein